jgi:hypothetical protein
MGETIEAGKTTIGGETKRERNIELFRLQITFKKKKKNTQTENELKNQVRSGEDSAHMFQAKLKGARHSTHRTLPHGQKLQEECGYRDRKNPRF